MTTTQPPIKLDEHELQHAAALDAWLEHPHPADKLAECRAYADRGVAARDPKCLQYAVSAILAKSLGDEQKAEAMQLLEHDIDQGVVKMDQPLGSSSPESQWQDFHRKPPLQLAIMCRNRAGLLLMIRKGALAVTDLRTQRIPGAKQKYQPAPGETAEDAFFRWCNTFFGGEQSRALILHAVMDWKLGTSVEQSKASTAPAPRRSS